MVIKQTRGTYEYGRVMAINMMRVKGFATLVAADALDDDRRTVSDWLDTYNSKRRDSLADDARTVRAKGRYWT